MLARSGEVTYGGACTQLLFLKSTRSTICAISLYTFWEPHDACDKILRKLDTGAITTKRSFRKLHLAPKGGLASAYVSGSNAFAVESSKQATAT